MVHDNKIDFQMLQGHQYISLATFRKNGDAIRTPVWFAQAGNRLYVMTMPTAGKVKRIRNNAQVEVAPCDVRGGILGESAEAMALVLGSPEAKHADSLLTKKYGLSKRLFTMMWRLRGIQPAYLEITAM